MRIATRRALCAEEGGNVRHGEVAGCVVSGSQGSRRRGCGAARPRHEMRGSFAESLILEWRTLQLLLFLSLLSRIRVDEESRRERERGAHRWPCSVASGAPASVHTRHVQSSLAVITMLASGTSVQSHSLPPWPYITAAGARVFPPVTDTSARSDTSHTRMLRSSEHEPT
jgi:hypothetical protein